MKDLRSEIRAAFEEEQSMYPPVGNLRQSVVRAAAAQPQQKTRLQWVAALAALVIAALVVGGLLSARLAARSVPAHPQPSPRAVGDYGTPPAGVPLIYLRDPNHASWYTGFDWSGHPRGTIKLAQPLDPSQSIFQAPDGSSFQVGQFGKPAIGPQLLDRLGKPVSGAGGEMWADDNSHTCSVALDQQQYTWTLMTGGPNQAARAVTVIAQDSGVGQTGISLAACSFKNDRAIAVRTSIAWPSELWVIRLSDGKVLAHNMINGNGQLANLVASSDATLVAKNSERSGGAPGGAPSTVIVRQSDGSVVQTLDPTMGVLSFSGDNTAALVTTSPRRNGQPAHLAVVDLATGKIVWRYDGTDWFNGFLVQPGGSAFAIMHQDPSDQGGSHPKVTVDIVSAQGAVTSIPPDYVRP